MAKRQSNVIYINDKDGFLDDLKANKDVFTLLKTTSTTTIEFNGFKYKHTSGKFLKLKEMYFLKKVKDYVEANCGGIVVDRTKIKYIKQGKLKKNYWYSKEIWEIDLNAAYWNFAFKSGYISKELFEEGKKVSKMCRLVSLGNLAKCVSVLNFNGSEFEFKETLRSEATEGVFFDVSQQTDAIMNLCRAIADNDFLFYWVDAIFIQGSKAKNEVENYLIENEIPYKSKRIDKVIQRLDFIECFDKFKGKEKKRIFNFKKVYI